MTGVVWPVLHKTVPDTTAVKLTVGLAQVSVALDGLMLTVGTTVLLKTITVAVAVQPLAPVMVTV
jgi:Tfp pilus assembly ATPase PilU